MCNVKYNATPNTSGTNSQQQRDHLFSKGHLNKLIQFVTNIAVENGANPSELVNGKLFTGFPNSDNSGAENNGSRSSKIIMEIVKIMMMMTMTLTMIILTTKKMMVIIAKRIMMILQTTLKMMIIKTMLKNDN